MSCGCLGLKTNDLLTNVSMLPRNSPVQIVLFSATFPDNVRNFANKFAPSANKIELQKTELSVDNIRQFYMDCRNEEHKYEVLVSLYNLLTIGQSIIFCQVRAYCRIGSYPALTYSLIASAHRRPYFTAYDGRGAQSCLATWCERRQRA